jgi:phosphinothricin acetyltransferase
MILRRSEDADIHAITKIYEHWVLHSSASFETDPPSVLEMAERRQAILSHGLPYYVFDVEGSVVGFAYATPYRPRAAYRFTVEDSIYVHPASTGKGIGHRLLAAVISRCEVLGYRQMIAVIGGSDNAASIALHRACGFAEAGLLKSAGYKFGRWADSVLMQRELGAGASTHPVEISHGEG